jgi:hypothetical protein
LNRARADELVDVYSQPAAHRCNREETDTGAEHPSPAEVIAQRSAGQKQRGEEESVGLDDPLNVQDGRVEAFLQGGQRDIHYRAVDEGHARSQDSRGQDPRLGARRAGSNSAPRSNDGFIAGLRSNNRHMMSMTLLAQRFSPGMRRSDTSPSSRKSNNRH